MSAPLPIRSSAAAAAVLLGQADASTDALNAHLTSLLHLLYWIAAILALLLVLVVVLAIRFYRQSRSSEPPQ